MDCHSDKEQQVVVRLEPQFALGDGEVGTRTLVLKKGQRVPVGRSSPTRPGAAPAADNAMIDSPVVSRSHAYFITCGEPERPGDAPPVFLIDESSMHGTTVNGKTLTKSEARLLHSHDRIALGVAVTRGNAVFPAKEFLCYISDVRSASPAGVSVSGTLSAPSDAKLLENEAAPLEDAVEHWSPSPASSVYEDDDDEGFPSEYEYDDDEVCYDNPPSFASDDAMSSVGSFNEDSDNDEANIGFDDNSDGSDYNGEVNHNVEKFEGQVVHEDPAPSVQPEAAGARGDRHEAPEHTFENDARCNPLLCYEPYDTRRYTMPPMFQNLLPVDIGTTQRNARAVSPEASQWVRSYTPEEPIALTRSFAVDLQPAKVGWRRDGAQVFPIPLPTPTVSDTNAGIKAEHDGYLFQAEEASPPSSPVLSKDDEESTYMPKAEEELRSDPVALARKVSNDRMMISSLVDGPNFAEIASLYACDSNLGKTVASTGDIHPAVAQPAYIATPLEVPVPAEGSEAVISHGLKRKHGDIADEDITIQALAPSSLTSENKAALGYALNAPDTVNDKDTDTIALDTKDVPSTVVETKDNADAERPAKRLRTVLGYAGTVAASVALGAVAVIGGLTALPEGFFE